MSIQQLVILGDARAQTEHSRARHGYAKSSRIQEGLRGVVRLPDGTAHVRDALFVESTYGPRGITVAGRSTRSPSRPRRR